MAMGVASLIAWILTALGGAYMLAKWVGGGGHRKPTNSKLPSAVVFGHFTMAAIGLVLWIIYVFTDNHLIGWIGLALLVPVAVLGFVMLARWIPTYRAQTVGGGQQPAAVGTQDVPERSFPMAVVAGHGALAVVTIVLALLAILG
jgi:hypothetical protein